MSHEIHAAQHSVHPTGGSLRVFKPLSWLEVGSVKIALSRPAHQPVTQAVRPHAGIFGIKREQIICVHRRVPPTFVAISFCLQQVGLLVFGN